MWTPPELQLVTVTSNMVGAGTARQKERSVTLPSYVGAKEIAYLSEAVSAELPMLAPEVVNAFVVAAASLWEAAGSYTDTYGGSESIRVLPAVIKTLLAESNPMREDFQ